MGNDDKLTSRQDDTPMDNDSENGFLPEGSTASSDLFAPEKKAATVNDKKLKTVSFSKPASPKLSPSLEANFGMPDFDFLDNPPVDPYAVENSRTDENVGKAEKAETKTPVFKTNLEEPLSNDTGWESVETIGRSSIGDDAAKETGDLSVMPPQEDVTALLQPQEEIPTPPKAEEIELEEPKEKRAPATVMPFPRNGYPRIVSDESSAEVTPFNLLRGVEADLDSLNEDAVSPSRNDDGPEGAPDFDAAAQDTLADAVQSALRNVYGARNSSEPDEAEAPDLGNLTLTDSLMSVPQLQEPDSWHEDDTRDWNNDSSDYVDDESEAAALAVDTESALGQFYSRHGDERPDIPDRQNTVLSGELSLRDYSEASGRPSEDWQDDDDSHDQYDDRRGGFPHMESGYGAPYRGDMAPPHARDMAPLHARDMDDGRDRRYMREPGDLFPGVAYSNEPSMPPNAAPNPEVEWRNQAAAYHVPHASAHPSNAPYYPGHLPATAPEHLASTGPDSGHLLGAAGLGLIGGIALAGVLAVFVFNSFVEDDGTARVASSAKVVERLNDGGTAPAEANVSKSDLQAVVREIQPRAELQTTPDELEQTLQGRSQPQPPVVATPNDQPQPQPQQLGAASRAATVQEFAARPDVARTPAPPPISTEPLASADSKLIARPVTGPADQQLDIDITITNPADAEDALVSLRGLPADAQLSTGIDVGGGQWLLPPAKLNDLTVTVPKASEGEYQLEVQLLKDDAQTSTSDALNFPMVIGEAPTDNRIASADAEEALRAARLAPLPDETPQLDTDFLTQTLIRDGNHMMRDGDIIGARRLYEQAAANGNPEAALAMGRSFDPSYFEKVPVKTGKPDPSVAFDWYKKALDGGLVTARAKIDALKQWLQR